MLMAILSIDLYYILLIFTIYHMIELIELDQAAPLKKSSPLRPLANLRPREENTENAENSTLLPAEVTPETAFLDGTRIAGWFIMENPENCG